ncbi:uncharacterized protein LOC143278071 [Babylonia areolata]|uniref:uncharacterized protein LOC143278071 n=1 Tax=Babylonia areolata TaxID=304850 RepID=UPI003FD0A406
MARMSMKNRRRLVMQCRVVGVLTLIVLFVTPIRNVVLSPFLPGCWLPYNTFRLVQMLMDNQHFPIDSPLSHPPPSPHTSSLTFNLSDVSKFLYKEDPFSEFFRQKEALEKLASTDPRAAEELAMMENFEPSMSLKERTQLMFTMHVFQTVCEKNHIQFFIFEGSLLGSYRHHGLVPWDDDLDIALNASEWQKVRRVLGNIPGFTLFAPPDAQWKFFLSDLPAFSDKPFRFPYLDLFFFLERGSYVWGITWGMKNHLMVQTKHLFPLTTVHWEMLKLPAPVCVQRMVRENYGLGCMTRKYNHKTNQVKYGFQTDRTDCQRLHKYLPFVFREIGKGGEVVEIRRVGNKVLQNVTLPATPQVCQED